MKKDERDKLQTSSASRHLRALDLQVNISFILESVIRLCFGCLPTFCPNCVRVHWHKNLPVCLYILSSPISFPKGLKQFFTKYIYPIRLIQLNNYTFICNALSQLLIPVNQPPSNSISDLKDPIQKSSSVWSPTLSCSTTVPWA